MSVDRVRSATGHAERFEYSVAASRSKIEHRDVGDRRIDELECGTARVVGGDIRGWLVQQSKRCCRHPAILAECDWSRTVGTGCGPSPASRQRIPARALTDRLAAMSVPYEETQLLPLITDQDIERRVADLIGRANSRQLWLLFLDEFDIQLPLLIPIEGLPSEPTDEQTDVVLERVRDVMGEIGATAVITVLERYGAPALTMQDAAWVRALHRGCSNRGVTLRAQLLSHRTGVRWIAAEETAIDEQSS
jgi:hypothetical protein